MCLIAYDIEEDKIRTKLSKLLEKQGTRMQKSVFVADMNKHAFKRMIGNIQKVTGQNGKVAVVRLCKGCQDNALHLTEDREGFHVF